MTSISKEYLFLFNALTDLQESLEQLRMQTLFLQQQAEELFLQGEEVPAAHRSAG